MTTVLEKFKKRSKPARTSRPAQAAKLFAHGTAPAAAMPLPPGIRSILDKVIDRQLRVSLSEFPVRLLTLLPALWLVQAGLDRALNLSWAVRLVLLLLDLAVAGALFYLYALLPWRKRLNHRTAALQVERATPRLRSSLISAVELAAAPPASPPGAATLVKRLLQNVGRDLQKSILLDKVVQTAGLKKRQKWMALSLLLFAACFVCFLPKSLILGRRILLSHLPLPTMTIVEAVTKEASIPAGTDIELAARATGLIPKNGRLKVLYDDGRKETINLSPKAVEPDVFTVTLRNVRQRFHYQFLLNDGVGSEYEVGIRMLPSLSLTRFTQRYPAYTGHEETEMSPGNLLLLNGSTLRIEAESSQPLKSAVLKLEGLDEKIPMEITGANKLSIRKEIPVPQEGLTGVSIHLESASGENSINDPVYRVELIQDKAPVVALLLPKTEKITVLATDAPSLHYTVRDDFGVKEAALVYEVFRAGPDGRPDLAERGRLPMNPVPPRTNIRETLRWDLSKLIPPLAVGNTVSYWIEANDTNTLPAPATAISSKKTMEVVSNEAKQKEFQDALSKTAEEIERIYKNQVKESEKTDSTIRSSQETKP
jgi:hypothetical protein